MKNKISLEEIKKLASLACLKISRQEAIKLQKDISRILKFIDQLNKLKVGEVEPTSQTTGLENIFRQDKPDLSISQEEALSQARSKYKGYFKTKLILKNEN